MEYLDFELPVKDIIEQLDNVKLLEMKVKLT